MNTITKQIKKVEVDLPIRAQRTVGTRFSYTEPGWPGSPDLNCICTHSVKVVLWHKITDARLFNAARLGLLNPLLSLGRLYRSRSLLTGYFQSVTYLRRPHLPWQLSSCPELAPLW